MTVTKLLILWIFKRQIKHLKYLFFIMKTYHTKPIIKQWIVFSSLWEAVSHQHIKYCRKFLVIIPSRRRRDLVLGLSSRLFHVFVTLLCWQFFMKLYGWIRLNEKSIACELEIMGSSPDHVIAKMSYEWYLMLPCLGLSTSE